MKSLLLATVFFLCPVIASADESGSLGAQGLSDNETEAVRQMLVAQSDSLAKGEVEKYASYWAEGAVVMPANHERIEGRDEIVKFVVETFPPGTTTTTTDWDIVGRDDLAVVTNVPSITVNSTPDATEVFDQIIVLRRTEGAWRVQAWIWTVPN